MFRHLVFFLIYSLVFIQPGFCQSRALKTSFLAPRQTQSISFEDIFVTQVHQAFHQLDTDFKNEREDPLIFRILEELLIVEDPVLAFSTIREILRLFDQEKIRDHKENIKLAFREIRSEIGPEEIGEQSGEIKKRRVIPSQESGETAYYLVLANTLLQTARETDSSGGLSLANNFEEMVKIRLNDMANKLSFRIIHGVRELMIPPSYSNTLIFKSA